MNSDGSTSSRRSRPSEGTPKTTRPKGQLPNNDSDAIFSVGRKHIKLTNLQKVFWPIEGFTKRDLLQYYWDVAPWLVPHIRNRAMVMKRYPNGINGEFFFMKRAPEPRPPDLPICAIEHGSGNVIGFPVINDVCSLLWLVNLGCIDLNPWYARCDDVSRPDYLHFDLDPVQGANFDKVLETSLIVREELMARGIKSFAKTTCSRGIHVCVPIRRGPKQKEVWRCAKAFSLELAARHPKTVTAEYRIAKRPRGRVLVDYNQNAWNRTLASVYSVRPVPGATVSMPVTWDEIEKGLRITKIGDLWKPVLANTNRVDLQRML